MSSTQAGNSELVAGSRNRVCRIARSWLGTPYHHMGRVKGAGVDCAMFPLEVYREELPAAGGSGQTDCDDWAGCAVWGGAGHADWDDCAGCCELFDGGAGQAVCAPPGCCPVAAGL